jgi:hypothetical protein
MTTLTTNPTRPAVSAHRARIVGDAVTSAYIREIASAAAPASGSAARPTAERAPARGDWIPAVEATRPWRTAASTAHDIAGGHPFILCGRIRRHPRLRRPPASARASGASARASDPSAAASQPR